ncbi:hypothetical protein KI688_007610 [Linnemannia hyalina]|uniref:Uncharacterized protein n=1 Tax=Linnemannia hyalina TaxID=64524 RepID=A0A9P8BPV1_9FUNG|nr:hypothetical protein KI688_007610 [Linnemannia hyalina]
MSHAPNPKAPDVDMDVHTTLHLIQEQMLQQQAFMQQKQVLLQQQNRIQQLEAESIEQDGRLNHNVFNWNDYHYTEVHDASRISRMRENLYFDDLGVKHGNDKEESSGKPQPKDKSGYRSDNGKSGYKSDGGKSGGKPRYKSGGGQDRKQPDQGNDGEKSD